MADGNSSNTIPLEITAFLAAISVLPAEQRAPQMRSILEHGLDMLQVYEQEFYTFIGECSMLAAENIQDIRLEIVENEIKLIKTPPEKEWGEVIFDVAAGFALQAIIIAGSYAGMELVLGGVLSISGLKFLGKEALVSGAELAEKRALNTAIESRITELQGKASQMQEALKANKGWGKIRPCKKIGEMNSIDFLQEFISTDVELVLARSARKQTSADYIDAIEAFQDVILNKTISSQTKKDWKAWFENNIGNEKGGLYISTFQDILSSVNVALSQDANQEVKSREPFLSSQITGAFLNWASAKRLETVEMYSALRTSLRATSDSELLQGDDLVFYITHLCTVGLPYWKVLFPIAANGRPAFSKALEVAFWREYLLASGILAPPIPESQYLSNSLLTAGILVGGRLILKDGIETSSPKSPPPGFTGEPMPQYTHETYFYSEANRIPELMASTLFMRFAKQYFLNENNRYTLLPFVYNPSKEPTKYDNIAIPPKDDYRGYPDPIAIQRIDEMRYMVIKFFMAMESIQVDASEQGNLPDAKFLKDVVGEQFGETMKAWLADQSVGTPLNVQDKAANSLSATTAAEQHFMDLATATGIAANANSQLIQIEEIKFQQMMTDLSLDILAYVLMESNTLEAKDLFGDRTSDQLYEEIKQEQDVVKDKYAELLKLAGNDRPLLDRLTAEYQVAKEVNTNWDKGKSWTWYGPAYVPDP